MSAVQLPYLLVSTAHQSETQGRGRRLPGCLALALTACILLTIAALLGVKASFEDYGRVFQIQLISRPLTLLETGKTLASGAVPNKE